jgi:predicted O-methyltransferase YrrM
MASSPYDLAQMAAHDLAASGAFPGPGFREVLGWIHEALRPATYVEIGVYAGCSLAAVQAHTLAIGIDPDPQQDGCWPTGSRIFRLTSTEFFAKHDLRQVLGGKAVDLALIDGFHLFEQALEDLCNLERHIAPGGVIAVHDTIPLDRVTSARTRTTEFYTGDVWKMVPYLRRYRPELEVITVTAAPTGLTLIHGLNPGYHPTRLLASTAEFAALEFDYFERNREEFLRTMPNHRSAIQAFCQNTPVQSIASSGVEMPSR